MNEIPKQRTKVSHERGQRYLKNLKQSTIITESQNNNDDSTNSVEKIEYLETLLDDTVTRLAHVESIIEENRKLLAVGQVSKTFVFNPIKQVALITKNKILRQACSKPYFLNNQGVFSLHNLDKFTNHKFAKVSKYELSNEKEASEVLKIKNTIRETVNSVILPKIKNIATEKGFNHPLNLNVLHQFYLDFSEDRHVYAHGGFDSLELDQLLSFVEQRYGTEKLQHFSILVKINQELSRDDENLYFMK